MQGRSARCISLPGSSLRYTAAGYRRRLHAGGWLSSSGVILTANLTATGLDRGGSSVLTRTANLTIPLGLDRDGHDSMELKILWSASSVQVRPPPPALKTPIAGRCETDSCGRSNSGSEGIVSSDGRRASWRQDIDRDQLSADFSQDNRSPLLRKFSR